MKYSHHIFYFPFQWSVPGMSKKLFENQIDLNTIAYQTYSQWERVQTEETNEEDQVILYNEKNYYYPFVHSVLYDQKENAIDLMHHYERKDVRDGKAAFNIKVKDTELYCLKIEAINLNLYNTGVGTLSFHLANDNYEKPEDILKINQYGRRIFPPFYGDIAIRSEIAEYISIEGLKGSASYYDDFNQVKKDQTWRPAQYILQLIEDLSLNLEINPVIDDRMFVQCWYINNNLCEQAKKHDFYEFRGENANQFWHKFIFVDSRDSSCQEEKMYNKLLETSTYWRWLEWSSIYGGCRYSLVYLTNSGVPPHLLTTFETIYARMVELVLVQRASVLRFSAEITKVSQLSKKEDKSLVDKISSLYNEYLRFVNQIYFREITTQEQGIELYQLLHDKTAIEKHVKSLDKEMAELHNYTDIVEKLKEGRKMTNLTILASIFLPFTLVATFFGMNNFENNMKGNCSMHWQTGLFFILGILGVFSLYVLLTFKRKK